MVVGYGFGRERERYDQAIDNERRWVYRKTPENGRHTLTFNARSTYDCWVRISGVGLREDCFVPSLV
jgi:hypothetical protein